jgi:lipopolysaccharide/colanic/teichoic acid biosynthesis glycosyltransferase
MQQIGFQVPGVPEPPLALRSRSLSYAAAKRAFDITFALFVIVVTAPVWLIVAALVGLTSPGPVIFCQPRTGRGGRTFTCYKFRTMVDGADGQKAALRHLNEMSGPVFKIRADPRITPVGRWLRRTSIDELPQLLNVLKGDMSVVGPRPLPVAEADALSAYHRQRHVVRPGLTCLWQVSGRSGVDFDSWMSLDLEYIMRRGFWYDLRIVLRTIPLVLIGSGAV